MTVKQEFRQHAFWKETNVIWVLRNSGYGMFLKIISHSIQLAISENLIFIVLATLAGFLILRWFPSIQPENISANCLALDSLSRCKLSI